MKVVYGFVNVFFKVIIVLLVTLLSLWLIVLSPWNSVERQKIRSMVSAAIGHDSWKSELDARIPLCLVWEVDLDGEILSSNFQVYEGANVSGFLPPYDTGEEWEDKLVAGLGNVMEPLQDRYPLVGRTITFGFVTNRLTNGNWIAAAYWQPFIERLYWFVYAMIIYLYLIYWITAPIWVYVDSKANGLPLTPFFALAAIANVVGVIAYLVWKRKQDASG